MIELNDKNNRREELYKNYISEYKELESEEVIKNLLERIEDLEIDFNQLKDLYDDEFIAHEETKFEKQKLKEENQRLKEYYQELVGKR